MRVSSELRKTPIGRAIKMWFVFACSKNGTDVKAISNGTTRNAVASATGFVRRERRWIQINAGMWT